MKIAHISDLHFGNHLPNVLEAFLRDLNQKKPDIIIVSGDITQRAKAYQFKLVQEFLSQISGKILAVPGNHDIPFYNIFNRIVRPLHSYQRYIGANYKSALKTDDITILGVSSVNPHKAIDGKLTSKTLMQINQFFNEDNKNVNLLFFHHNFDHIEGLHKPLENEDQFLNYLITSNIDVVCTGHLHYAHVGFIKKTNNKLCLILHAGSLLCGRSKDGLNSYFLIDVDSPQCSVDWRVFTENEFQSRKIYELKFTDDEVNLE